MEGIRARCTAPAVWQRTPRKGLHIRWVCAVLCAVYPVGNSGSYRFPLLYIVTVAGGARHPGGGRRRGALCAAHARAYGSGQDGKAGLARR